MEILGIGPMELLLIVVIALIVLGPKDMVKTGQRLGRMLRIIIRSPAWSAMMNTSRELRNLPTRMVREAGLEEDVAELNKMREQLKVNTIPEEVMRELDLQEEVARLKAETSISMDDTSGNKQPAESPPSSEGAPSPQTPPLSQPGDNLPKE